jgi:hypothetical protein
MSVIFGPSVIQSKGIFYDNTGDNHDNDDDDGDDDVLY